MGIIWILLCVILLMVSIGTNRDVANPVFISGAIWLIMYIILLITNNELISSDIYYGSFAIAFLFFFIGFYIVTPKYKEKRAEVNINYEWNQIFGRIILLLEYIIVTYSFAKGMGYFSSGNSIWNTLRVNKQYFLTGIEIIIFEMVPIVFFVTWAMFVANPVKQNKKYMLLSLPPLFIVILFTSRGNWFYILITVVFTYIYIKRVNIGKIIKYGISGVVIILVVFIISSFDKFSNAYLWMGTVEKIIFFLELYFVIPSISYVNWLHSDYILGYGKYIFRFFCALFQPIFPNIEVVDIIMPFVKTNGILGNVYTSLQWYTFDFGLIGTFIIQVFLGGIYGILYRNIRSKQKPSFFIVILLAMFMYPIANQFFSETLVSILSSWIQRVFWLFLFTRPRWYVKSTVEREQKYGIKKKKIRFVW